MRRIFIILSVIIVAMSCQSNSFKSNPVGNSSGKQALTLPFFNEIQLLAATDLYIKQTENDTFAVEYESKDGEYAEITVKDGVLTIKSKKNKKLPEKITVSVPELKSISIISSGNVFQIGNWNFKSLTLSAEASGDFNLQEVNISTFLETNVAGSGNVKIDTLRVLKLENNVAGSGNITIKNLKNCQDINSNIAGSGNIAINSEDTVGVSEVNIVGSGDFHSESLKAYTNYVNITGSGKAYVNTISLIDVNIIGSGDVYYLGNPKLTKTILGSGKVYSKK